MAGGNVVKTIEELDKRRNKLSNFASTAISMSMERCAQYIDKGLSVQGQLRVANDCEHLDALSTLMTAILVDVISDGAWIDDWARVLNPEDDHYGIYPLLIDEVRDIRTTAIRILTMSIAEIEWFHTMQHAAQKGEKPDFQKLSLDKTWEEALEENDPEMAMMICIGDWLADHGDPDQSPMDSGQNPYIDEVVRAIAAHMTPVISNRVKIHVEILSRLESGEIDSRNAHREMHAKAKELDGDLDAVRIDRRADATKVLDPKNILKELLEKIEKRLQKDLGEDTEVKIFTGGPDGIREIGGDSHEDDEVK